MVSPEELMKGFQEDGVIPAPAEAPKAPQAATPVPASTPAPEQKKEELPALLRIAKERDAFRKESEALKPYLEALKVLSPTEAQRIAKARAAGDPAAALAALGFSHEQYNAAIMGQKGAPSPEPEDAPSSELAAMKHELVALRAERDQERVQSSRRQLLGQMKAILQDSPAFDHINKLEDYEGVERVLIQYHSEHGELPGATLEESVQLAAEMYESRLKKEAARWSKVLTGFKESAPVAKQQATESKPVTGTVSPPRTLTNANTSAPAEVRTTPKTREEILAALIEGRDDALE